MILVTCVSCSRQLRLKDELAGRTGKCPSCGEKVTVPENQVPAAPTLSSPKHRAAEQSVVEATVPPQGSIAYASGIATRPPAEESQGNGRFPEETVDGSRAGAARSASDLVDFLASPQRPDELGRLGPYRVLEVLGQGGMGVVFRAEDPHLERMVALKAMLPSLAASAFSERRGPPQRSSTRIS